VKFTQRLKEKIKSKTEEWKQQSKRRNEEFERQMIEQQVERIKERARRLGVEEFMGKFFNDVGHYPAWFKNKNLSPSISSVKELDGESREGREWRNVQLTLKNKTYICAFEEHECLAPVAPEKHGTFELYLEGKKVLALKMSFDIDEYYSEWRSFGIEAFVEGDWVKDFREYIERCEKETKERLAALGKKPVDELKDNFGIS